MANNRTWLWLLPIAILIACGVWQMRQNSELASQLRQALAQQNIQPVITPPPCPELPPVVQQKPMPSAPKPLTPLEDVFNPEPGSPQQSALDDMKSRYEALLVNYFFLRKCKKTFPTDYHVILSALGQEMASINAPGRLQNDILTAAQGSYKEMYARDSCADPGVDALATKYRRYIDAVTKEYVVP